MAVDDEGNSIVTTEDAWRNELPATLLAEIVDKANLEEIIWKPIIERHDLETLGKKVVAAGRPVQTMSRTELSELEILRRQEILGQQ